MARTLKATGLYKSQRFIGSTITINDEPLPPVTYPGTIVEVYWASDAQGLNRTTEGTFDDARYLIVKTKDIPDAVTLYLNSAELTTSDMELGILNNAITIPLLVDGSGNGFGFYKILTTDEDEMAFRNSKWVNVSASRRIETTYTNNTGQTISVAISTANGREYLLVVDDVLTGLIKPGTAYDPGNVEEGGGYRGDGTMATIVPPGSTYRVFGGMGGTSTAQQQEVVWSELRKQV